MHLFRRLIEVSFSNCLGVWLFVTLNIQQSFEFIHQNPLELRTGREDMNENRIFRTNEIVDRRSCTGRDWWSFSELWHLVRRGWWLLDRIEFFYSNLSMLQLICNATTINYNLLFDCCANVSLCKYAALSFCSAFVSRWGLFCSPLGLPP